jgi:hypothetical protein
MICLHQRLHGRSPSGTRVKLTAGRIREFLCRDGKGQDFLWEAEAPWLAVRATPGSEVKTFIFQSRIEKKTIRAKIGGVDAWGH